MLTLVEEDMSFLVRMVRGVYRNLSPEKDDKLERLITALQSDPQLQSHKVVLFTEFKDTARYLWRELQARGFTDLEELDSTRRVDREVVIKRFAPYYNCTPEERVSFLARPIRLLISTDVLSEGLNLQDAHLIINYDLHWNPVRLMQRIGRVDRRLDPEIEQALERDGTQFPKVYVYNFLPPEELDDLLRLHQRVTGKLLRISKTLGIEAPVLGTEAEEEFESLRLFNEIYLGRKSIEEQLHEELEALQREHPALFQELSRFPRRVFSGKEPGKSGTRGLFCAYRFPSPPGPSEATGELRWYFRQAETGEIWESGRLADIAESIRSQPDTARTTAASAEDLQAWRREIELKCVNRTLRDLNAQIGVKATLVCWMEVC